MNESHLKIQNTEVLLIVNVDIGKTEVAQIFYHKNDDIEKLADEFIIKNQLDKGLKVVLLENLKEKIEEFTNNEKKLVKNLQNFEEKSNPKDNEANHRKNDPIYEKNDNFDTPQKFVRSIYRDNNEELDKRTNIYNANEEKNKVFNDEYTDSSKKIKKMNNFIPNYLSEKKAIKMLKFI